MTLSDFFTPAWTPAWTAALINHLWQSTAVVLVAWLLTLVAPSQSGSCALRDLDDCFDQVSGSICAS